MVVEENEENPSVRFNKIVLTWDYLRLPEAFKEDKKKKGAGPNLPKVKDTYTGYDDYISTFEPLLFEEVRAQIVQNKDEEEGSVWIAGFVSKFTETDDFHLVEVRCVVPESQEVFISQNDLLFLSKEKFEAGLKLRLPTTHAFALVEQLQKLEEGKQAHDVYLLRLRMYLGEIVQVRTSIGETRPERIADQQKEDKKTIARLMNMRLLITSPNESDRYLHILKVCSLSTIVREYAALLSINNLPFKNLILTAAERIPSSDDKAWTISKPLVEYMEDKLNPSQQEALNAGLSRKDFVLIQGPPGTGKTQTILGILSAVLHATPARVGLKSGSRGVKRGPEMSMVEKCDQWARASPWITGTNPRDMIMPTDGDSGFFPTTGNEFKPEVINSSRKYRTRVLVCAPSNSALDEIISRVLKTGVRDEYNHAYNPKIVRVGLKAHYSVKSVSMDDLVKQRLAVHSAADKQKQGAGRDTDNIRASLLDEAAIVFSTLSFSGSNLFSRLNRGFDVVIIDEAAQAIEPATLIPLANGCKQVYLVGDPLQLPATVISPKAAEHGYGMSLFKRLQSAGYPVVMLKTQYRMHPEIRSFPSDEFYEGALEDGEDMVEKTERDWHRYRCFGPFCFFDIPGKESDASGSGSWVNEDEVDFVLVMYHKLVARYPVLKSSSQLAIICPYRHQLKLFKKRFRETFGEDSEKFVDINTVDGFQGREKDVAIFSCVRANEKGNIGFVSDARRMNVGITRARASVLVVGSASTLKKNDAHWRSLVESAERRNSLFKVPKPYESFFSDENLKTMDVREKVEENPEEQDYDTGPVFGIPNDAPAEPEDEPDFGDGDGDAGFDED